MEERLYFPLFFDLSEQEVLIVGGGRIAARRVKTILPFAGKVIVVAPDISEEIRCLDGKGKLALVDRAFEDTDLLGCRLVLCATGDTETDARVRRLCTERGIPVNIASDKEQCDFYFPGIARNGNVVVGVTACGTDHKKAKETTAAIRKLIGG